MNLLWKQCENIDTWNNFVGNENGFYAVLGPLNSRNNIGLKSIKIPSIPMKWPFEKKNC